MRITSIILCALVVAVTTAVELEGQQPSVQINIDLDEDADEQPPTLQAKKKGSKGGGSGAVIKTLAEVTEAFCRRNHCKVLSGPNVEYSTTTNPWKVQMQIRKVSENRFEMYGIQITKNIDAGINQIRNESGYT